MKRSLLVVLIAGLAACATAPSGDGARTVDVEGWAPEGPGAREAATADAQKRAVEKAFGVSVAAATKVEAAVTVKRRIWAAALGKVTSWTVLGERVESGMTVVRLRAAVRRAEEGEAVPPPVEATVRVAADGPAASGLRRAFGAAGFAVVEGEADFVATARSSARTLKDPRTAPFVTGRARVAVTLAEAATGAVVAELSNESARLASAEPEALAAAGETAGERAGTTAARRLSELLWKR